MKVNIINEGAKYGLICGLTAVLIMFGSWAAGLSTFTTVQFYTAFTPYMLVIILLGGFQLRKQNEGYLSFAESLKFKFSRKAEIFYNLSKIPAAPMPPPTHIVTIP